MNSKAKQNMAKYNEYLWKDPVKMGSSSSICACKKNIYCLVDKNVSKSKTTLTLSTGKCQSLKISSETTVSYEYQLPFCTTHTMLSPYPSNRLYSSHI